MTVQVLKLNTRASQTTAYAIRHHPFTVHDYHRMRTVGILQEDDRVELLDGEIYATSPIGPSHAAIVNRLLKWLSQQLSDDYILSVQNPVQLSEISEPQPDLAILLLVQTFMPRPTPRLRMSSC